MSSPTDALIRAAAELSADHALGRPPRPEAIEAGVTASAAALPPDARDAARRHLAMAEWLRALADHEPADRAETLRVLAEGHDIAAAVCLDSLPRMAA